MKQQYTVVNPLKHDGKTYKKDELVALEEINASYLLRRGDIAEKKAENPQAVPANKEK